MQQNLTAKLQKKGHFKGGMLQKQRKELSVSAVDEDEENFN
jgi:hypothetical protein